jgi:hypothetical protein
MAEGRQGERDLEEREVGAKGVGAKIGGTDLGGDSREESRQTCISSEGVNMRVGHEEV